MAMKNASALWLPVVFITGLLFLFLGERPFGHIDVVRMIFSGVGLLTVLGITGLRVRDFLNSSGERKAVARLLLYGHAGVLVALLLYLTTTTWGHGVLGVEEGENLDRFQVPMTILWSIIMAASVLPLLMIRVPLVGAGGSDAQMMVDAYRAREMARSGLTIALAASFVMVTCNVADQRNVRRDVSYFKTSSPGSATVSVTKDFARPVKVLLFFPQVNEVKNEVRGYFQTLADETGNNIIIEEHDQLVSPELAKKYKVNNNGTVVLAVPSGDAPEADGAEGDAEGKDGAKSDVPEKSESFKLTIETDRRKRRTSRTELRELDSKVNTALMKLRRERLVAYLTVGHGELNDSSSQWATAGGGVFAKRGGLKANRIKQTLRNLNFQVKDLGLAQGLSNEVPKDASLVLILGPTEPLLDEELAALDRYLAKGGRVLFALDPLSRATLGSLEGRLGVRYNPTPLADDKLHARFSGRDSDKRWVITDRFSSHASITTLTRAARAGILVVNSGSFDEVEFAGGGKPKRTIVVKTRSTTFNDGDNNYTFSAQGETRKQYNLVAAIEDGEAVPDDAGEGAEGMRAMVFSDVEIFSDYVQERSLPAVVLYSDAVKWLGGEEDISGEIVSEKDVAIEHTKNEDVVLFYATIFGAPILILVLGLGFAWWRRQRMQRRVS